MTSENEKKVLERLIAFMRDRGLIYGPSPEIYGGFAGFYTYGPLGKRLKNSIENFLRKYYYRYDFWEVELPTIMPAIVWKASGHLDRFKDPVITCKNCKGEFRADNLIEEQLDKKVNTIEEMKSLIKQLRCPSCNGSFDEKIEMKSLMIEAKVANSEAYCRPETATTTYLPFIYYYNFFRKKLPFGIFQTGKAYRNEINPRQHILRCREFTQFECQLFIFENQKNMFQEKLKEFQFEMNLIDEKDRTYRLSPYSAWNKNLFKNNAYLYCIALTYKSFLDLGFSPEKIRLRQHKQDEKAFYALDAWDAEILLPSFGWKEVCGIHDRSNYDLTQHSKFSNQSLTAFNEETQKQEIPHILEIAYGIDRIIFAMISNCYEELEKEEGKSTLRLPKHIAPIPVAVLPLLRKPELIQKTFEIKSLLEKQYDVFYDETGSIGRRYLRCNLLGIPYVITIDFQTLEDSSVTIRDRDSEKQIRVKKDELLPVLEELFGEKTIEDFKDKLIKE
ncbi:MAG: glycine--tRNA ligase [Candidatus Woesearchaeota archaeon]